MLQRWRNVFICLGMVFFPSNGISAQMVQDNGQVIEDYILFGLLTDRHVLDDLELSAEQRIGIQSLMKLAFEQLHGKHDAKSGGRRHETWIAFSNSEFTPKLEKLLLPFQRDRLKQLRLQQLAGFSGVDGGLLNREVSSALELTTRQVEDVEAGRREALAEIDNLKKAYRDRYMVEFTTGFNEFAATLSTEQRKLLESRVGPMLPEKGEGKK